MTKCKCLNLWEMLNIYIITQKFGVRKIFYSFIFFGKKGILFFSISINQVTVKKIYSVINVFLFIKESLKMYHRVHKKYW